jgi:hypothetical protein
MADDTLDPPQRQLPSNPFADYGAPEDDPAGLTPGPAPSRWESFKTNIVGAFQQNADSVHAMSAHDTIERAKTTGVAQPGDSPFAGKPSQSEVDQAIADLGTIRKRRERYDSFESQDFVGKATGFVGGVLGGIAAPENMFFMGAPIARGVSEAGLSAIGHAAAPEAASTLSTGARVGLGALEAGGINAGLDIAGQGASVRAGLQDEIDPASIALSFGFGAALGGGMHGALAWMEHRMPKAAAESKPFPQDGISEAPPAAEAAPGDQATTTTAHPDTPPVEGQPAPAPKVPDPAVPEAADIPVQERPPVQERAPQEPARTADTGGVTGNDTPRPAPQIPDARPVESLPAHTVVTPDNIRVEVIPVVVDAEKILTSADAGYDPSLQPRDRSRAASGDQVRDIATNLDPNRLGVSGEADRGAPIVGPDGMVESGNGRVAAIRRAYEQNGPQAEAYRKWLEAQGIDTTGMKMPVLVRERTTPLSAQDRQKFTIGANRDATLRMSATERAMSDATLITPEMADLLRNPANIAHSDNRDFVKALMNKLPQTERGAMLDADGAVSAEGARRVRDALLAKAYGDVDILRRVAEDTSDEIKSISNALIMSAPDWMKMRADVAAGLIKPELDLTKDLVEAVKRTADLRRKGISLDTFLRQMDAFDRPSAETETFMRWFYNGNLKRAASAADIADSLRVYATEARKVTEGGFDFGTPKVGPRDVQDVATRKRLGDTTSQGDIFKEAQDRRQALMSPDEREAELAWRKQESLDEQSGQTDLGSGNAGDRPQALRPGSDAGGQEHASGGGSGALRAEAGQGAAAGGEAGSAQPLKPGALANRVTPFNRARLPDEPLRGNTGHVTTPAEAQNFRITVAMHDIAARLGRKLEVDGRFRIKNALGEYAPKTGVLRIRDDGDMEVFAHELGHAIDQDVRREAGSAWQLLQRQYATELKPLDLNHPNPAQKTIEEGLAEYLRRYINNPAAARKAAPGFTQAMEQMLAQRAPKQLDALMTAGRISQIGSGMNPLQAGISHIAPPPMRRGVMRYVDLAKREGIVPSMRHIMDDFSASVLGRGNYVRRMVNEMLEAAYEKTGRPMAAFEWDNPYKRFRMLPGSSQTALDQVTYGVRDYNNPGQRLTNASLHGGFSKAFNGDLAIVADHEHPLHQTFATYLAARRARGEYARFNAGDLDKKPWRLTEAETVSLIADVEQNHPRFVEGANEVFAHNKALWQRKFDAGLITKEWYDAVNALGTDYVPFKREFAGTESGGGASKTELRSGVSSFHGSDKDIINPLHTMLVDAMQTERVIAINDVWKSVYKLAQMGGEFSGRFVERLQAHEIKGPVGRHARGGNERRQEVGHQQGRCPACARPHGEPVRRGSDSARLKATETHAHTGERIAFVYLDGQRVPLKIGNGHEEIPNKFFDLMAMTNDRERDWMMKVLSQTNVITSSMVTNAPSFFIGNIIADMMTRPFIAKNIGALGRIPGVSHGVGIYKAIFDREFVREYNALGGIRGGVVSHAARMADNGSILSAASQALRPRTLKERLQATAHVFGSPMIALKELPKLPLTLAENLMRTIEWSETVGRYGHSAMVESHLIKQGVDPRFARLEGVYEARDIMDYDHSGLSVGRTNRALPFLNAGMQGLRRGHEILFSDPVRSALSAYKRGGYQNLDGEAKNALGGAMKAWGLIVLGTLGSAIYYSQTGEKDYYRRAGPYLRRRYFIFDGGVDKDGVQKLITIRKPFDHAGAVMAATEMAWDGIRTKDPQAWGRVFTALEDGVIPRQFTSWSDLAGANPFVKILFETQTGQKLPFEGGPSFPIVPAKYAKLPPAEQYSAQSSWAAIQIGRAMGYSPFYVDHMMNGMGLTVARDANALLTSTMSSNPNMTPKDALLQATVGNVYRSQHGSGEAGSDFNQLVGRDTGSYMQMVRNYRDALETRADLDAEQIYKAAPEAVKPLMILHGNAKFTPEMRQLDPLEHGRVMADILNSVRRDLGNNQVAVQDRSKKRGQEHDIIEVAPPIARTLTNIIERSIYEEYRNALTVAGVQGYEKFDPIDTSANLAMLRKVSPQVADEVQKRMDKAHVFPAEAVRQNWPEVQKRLLQDQDQARLGDIAARVRVGAATARNGGGRVGAQCQSSMRSHRG